MTIAHNLAVDRLRRDTGVSRPTLVLVDEVPEMPGVDEEDAVIERDAAMRAIGSLSEAERLLWRARTSVGSPLARSRRPTASRSAR